MGAQQSNDILYDEVRHGNIEAVIALHRCGAGLEWMDKKGRTPLILACARGDSLEMILTLLNLDANLNAYRSGFHGGTPLHHAAKKGHDKIVTLLLDRGANPLVINDGYQTPLQMARARCHVTVVRLIEGRISLFCGMIREIGFSGALVPEWVSKKIWAVVLPSASNNPRRPPRFELVIYAKQEDSYPRTIISLSNVEIEEHKLSLPHPMLVLFDKSTKIRYKFLSETDGDKNQLQRLYEACKWTHQQCIAATASENLPLPEDVQLAMAINASLLSLSQERIPFSGAPSIDISPIGVNMPVTDDHSAHPSTSSNISQGNSSGSCVICWDAPAEAVCIPCGHLAGCMACLIHVKGKTWVCPVCRASIEQVVKVYAVGLNN